MEEIVPILLAGGSGTRLWPLSRKSYPKQFLKIFDDLSLFQKSALRSISSNKIKFKPHITVTHSNFRFFISEQLLSLGIDPGPILIEPETKNTAPAILSATLFAHKIDSEAILLVAPSDHYIPDTQKFHEALHTGIAEVKKGEIVTFGILPSHPETGYGYIKFKENNICEVMKIEEFIEKPDIRKAKKMVSQGNYLWNSGIFLFKAKDMIDLFKKFLPELSLLIEQSISKSIIDLGFVRLDPQIWSECTNISIDYGIMEKAKNLSVVPFKGQWSDLGDWNTIWEKMIPDKNGVSLSPNAYNLNCHNTLLRSENKNQIIVGSDLNDIIAIAMQDAVLVANKNNIQNIKKVVDQLKLKDIPQAEISLKDHRPWGNFEILAKSDGFQIKKLIVNPGAILSLQRHNYRSEHWIVLEGFARVTIDKEIKKINTGESIFIPKQVTHRIENIGESKTVIIEIQVGEIIDENDIIRYEDIYSRD